MFGIHKKNLSSILLTFTFILANLTCANSLDFSDNSLDGWEVVGENVWTILDSKAAKLPPNSNCAFVIESLANGEDGVGTLRSGKFTITKGIQSFYIAGADGTKNATNNGKLNFVLLRSYPDGEILRQQKPPGVRAYSHVQWRSFDLIGREVYLEVVDNNPKLYPSGYAWVGFGGYEQKDWGILKKPVDTSQLYSLNLESPAQKHFCRTMPFIVGDKSKSENSIRVQQDGKEIIPLGFKAKTIYILGLINFGWEEGTAFWSEHPELKKNRDDQLYIGATIGDIEIKYCDNSSDKVPLTIGATAWIGKWWHGIPQPYATRTDYYELWQEKIKFRYNNVSSPSNRRYFLAIKPKSKKIESIIIHDNMALRGTPLVSAINVLTKNANPALTHLGKLTIDRDDIKPAIRSYAVQDFSKDINALADSLYTSEKQLPKKVDLLTFPDDIDATSIKFIGDVKADMLSNIWVANLYQMDKHKFNAQTGFFRESQPGAPSYGGYMGMGTWAPSGTYAWGAFSRCSDHYATLGMRCINNDLRITNYVDFCDKYLYYHRNNNDPKLGPPNDALDISRYPADAPPHWSFLVNDPLKAVPTPLNEIAGNQELDGHGATITARWVAWRLLGATKGEWLTAPREEIYGKSRWDSTFDATEFICWLMDYTGMDVIYSEGETTGWGLGRVPSGWVQEIDPEKIKYNYRNSDMYEPYPTYVCMTALRCAAQMAQAVGEEKTAAKWLSYADRIQSAMIRLLAVGDHSNRCWKLAHTSIYPNQQECLVQAWYSIYFDGLDPVRLNPEMTQISRNTLKRNLELESGHHPVFGFGYGIGWLTKSALILDHMDDAGELLLNIAKYSYDKNMDYSDESRNIDWRQWLWLIPEGTNILPNGRWHRIGDLSNGANQGITLHALELCAGIDDTKPAELKIMPRVPDPLTGLEIENFFTLIPDGNNGLKRARINYSYDKNTSKFELTSDIELPNISVRIGPFSKAKAKEVSMISKDFTTRIESSGFYNQKEAWWVWFEEFSNVSEISLP